jgi:hypothetical protein
MTKEKTNSARQEGLAAANSARAVTAEAVSQAATAAATGKGETASRRRQRTQSAELQANAGSPNAGAISAPAGSSTSATKTDLVLKELRTPHGATLESLMRVTGWQVHSVRGFLSATVRKKLELDLLRETDADGISHYRVVDPVTVSDEVERRPDKPRVRRTALSRIQQLVVTE